MPSEPRDRRTSQVEKAAEAGNVLGFNTAMDALFIKHSNRTQCIAWTEDDESQMVTRNVSYRGNGSWGESRVFTGDRSREFVEKADGMSIIDKRPYNYIRRPICNWNGLGVGTAWALAFFFEDAGRIVSAREHTLKAVPGIGEKKARQIRRAVGHLPEPAEVEDAE